MLSNGVGPPKWRWKKYRVAGSFPHDEGGLEVVNEKVKGWRIDDKLYALI